MSMANHKTRTMRGFQPTWYQYADPVFIGGESWWNFQYTASLAGSIMDDWMRYYESNDGDSTAWAARVNRAAKVLDKRAEHPRVDRGKRGGGIQTEMCFHT